MPQPPQQSFFPATSSHNNNLKYKNENENKNNYNDNRLIGCDDINDRYALVASGYKMGDACNDASHGLSQSCRQRQQQLEQLKQQQQQQLQQQKQHIYENIKFDLRFSQKLLLQNLFRNRKNADVIYENLCRGCGYGVFESHGNLCNFCACIVNGIKSRQVREIVENSRIYVDTGENIYENICGKCSNPYNTEECQSCKTGNSLQDEKKHFINEIGTDPNPFVDELTHEIKEIKSKTSNKRDKRNIFHGLFGSLKRTVKLAQASGCGKRKHLDIIHNVDGFDNVFRTQETFDLKRICELKRSQSSEQPIYGRLKHKNTNKDNICSSTQTLPTKLEQSRSHDHLLQVSSTDNLDIRVVTGRDAKSTFALGPAPLISFAQKFGLSKTKRPRISKLRLLRSLGPNPNEFNSFVNEPFEQYQSQRYMKPSLYLTDSVCHWMTLLRYQVEKYCSYGFRVNDENYDLCIPKSIPSKNAFQDYSSSINIDNYDVLSLELLANIGVMVTKCKAFHNNNRLIEDNFADQFTESVLESMVNDFKLKLMSKQQPQLHQHHHCQRQHKHDQKHIQEKRQQTAVAAPNIEFVLTATACSSELDPEQQAEHRGNHTTADNNVGARCVSQHDLTPATTTQLLLAAVDKQGLTSCCAHNHVITAVANRSGFYEYDSGFVNGIQPAPYSWHSSHTAELKFETGYRTVNTFGDKSRDRTATEKYNTQRGETGDELLNRENNNKSFATITELNYRECNNNHSIICSVAENQSGKVQVRNHLPFREGASTIPTLDVFQIVRSSLISNSLNKTVIYYDGRLVAFLRNIHNNLYGARNTQINHLDDQLERKYERFCARLKRAFAASSRELIESSIKLVYAQDCDGRSGGNSVGNCVDVAVVTSYQGSALNESVVREGSKKIDNYEARAISDKRSAQIETKRVIVSEHPENKNVNLIKKKSEGEDDQDSFEKMKTNEEVVLRPKGKEDVGRNKKAQGAFLDSTNGASNLPEWNEKQSNAISNVANKNKSVQLGESPESRKNTQITLEKHKIPISSNAVTLITAPTSQTTNANNKIETEQEENIYQPIWKFKTVGEAKEHYQTDADYYDESSLAAITATALASKLSRAYDSSSMHVPNILVSDYVEDHCEWETDDEFQFIKQFGGEVCDAADTVSISSAADVCSMESSAAHSLLSTTSENTTGSTITGFESSNATLASAASSNLKNSSLRSVGIFYSLTEPKLRAIIYEYERTNASLYFAKNRSSDSKLYSEELLAKQCAKKIGASEIGKAPKGPPVQTFPQESKVPTGTILQKTQFLPDSVQAWKFMLLDVYYLEDEEDMIVAESEILRAQEFKESTADTQTQHLGQQLNTLQRFKSASFGNLVDLPIEDDKKSIAERMRNKLQRGVFKLNMRSPKSEKKSRGIFRRMETGSLYLEEGMKPKYPIFGAPLDQMEMDETTHPHVPRFVVDCVAYIEQKECILQDGLYRASGNKVAIDELKQKLSESYIYDSRLLVADDIHTLTSLLKQFFRELPIPLILQRTYGRFGRNISDVAGIELLREAFEDMCEPNRSTLKFLIRHLKNVAACSAENRMPASNLAIVWGPCLFSANQVEFVDIGRMNTLAKVLIENYERIFSESERLVS